MNRIYLLLCYVVLFAASCVEPYPVPMTPSNAGYLVVEGFINNGGPTTIQLTHTLSLNDEKGKPLPELRAQVTVESEDKNSYSLSESGTGSYRADYIPVDLTKKYRLHIKTIDNKEYASDFVEVKKSSTMDSVTWEIDYEKRGIQFYVYAHDPEDAARYYHWEYSETWQYHTVNPTSWEYVNGQVVRNYSLLLTLYNCWMTQPSSDIVTFTTTKLSKDVVYRLPLAFIPGTSEKLEIAYHMQVKQYAVTRDAFDYLQLLKKNTEQRGSIFDAQPSHLTGNIRCISNPEESVLGYVGAHGSDEKSIMIVAGGHLPGWFSGKTTYSQCPAAVGSPNYIAILLKSGSYLPCDNPLDPDHPTYQPKICVDCRVRGGTNVKPDYWPY